MEERICELRDFTDITQEELARLQTMRESCVMMYQRLEGVKDRMSEHDRQILEAYLDLRDELEFQTVKTALRMRNETASF